LAGAGAGAPCWDTFGDALEHLMVAALKRLAPRWLLAETREEEVAVPAAAKGRETSVAAAGAELVAAMLPFSLCGVGTWQRWRLGWRWYHYHRTGFRLKKKCDGIFIIRARGVCVVARSRGARGVQPSAARRDLARSHGDTRQAA
jgi:hypothetical protein